MAEFPIIPPESIKWTFGLGEWKPKVWGRTRTIFRDDQIEIVECEILKGGYSSEHIHHRKHNEFRVLSGSLRVTVTGSLIPKTTIGVGESWFYEAGDRHQFEAIADTRLIEIYTSADGSPVDPDDIERFTTGGLRK